MRYATLLLLLALGALIAAPAVRAENIVDRTNFFSPEAIRQAEQSIAKLELNHNVPVRVETFESLPGDQAEKVKGMSAKERGEFFASWLKEMAQERKAKGVFVLICREPSHLRMGVSKELHKRGFTDADRDAATEKLIAAFKAKEYDRGLQDVLGSIRTTAERRFKTSAKSPDLSIPDVGSQPTIGLTGWLCIGVLGLIALMGIIGVVASLFRGGSGSTPAPAGYGGGYGGGGGGWMGGLLSGFGGALLGNWMYDQWSGRSAHAGEHDNSSSGHTTSGHDNNDQDFSSSGGDFGDSGGGDFGGGDSGGDGGGDF